MLKDKTLENYADLVIKFGVNLQKGQGLEIICPVEKREIAHALTRSAYKAGAKIVRMRWHDELFDKINYEHADTSALSKIPKWYVDSKNYLVENGYCYIAVSAEDPAVFKDIAPEKIATVAKARSKALKKFSDQVMANGLRWCVVSVPTPAWAKQVFPNSNNPEEELSIAIEKTMRLDMENPTLEWDKHIQTLERRASFLNDKNFEYIHFKNAKGTDLMVGLANEHQWISAREKAQDGIHFVANMPTEEVFTAPHREKVDGTLVSALPLCENGQIIDEFSITFKKGKIVDFTAKKGYETLKHLIETDSGTRRLGEIALIGKNSPVAKCNTLFYNTLFDENASCHLAIGKAYPTTVKNGESYSIKQLKEMGVNDSTEHIDFMIGTPDLQVTGIAKDGTKTTLFVDGEWVI
jgi:aminopeptidase